MVMDLRIPRLYLIIPSTLALTCRGSVNQRTLEAFEKEMETLRAAGLGRPRAQSEAAGLRSENDELVCRGVSARYSRARLTRVALGHCSKSVLPYDSLPLMTGPGKRAAHRGAARVQAGERGRAAPRPR